MISVHLNFETIGLLNKKLVSNPLLEPPHDKTNKMTVRPAKTQISLGIRPVWSESSLCAHWVAKGPSFLHADSEDTVQTERMPRLIWVFAGRNAIMLVLSRGGSLVFQTVAIVLVKTVAMVLGKSVAMVLDNEQANKRKRKKKLAIVCVWVNTNCHPATRTC